MKLIRIIINVAKKLPLLIFCLISPYKTLQKKNGNFIAQLVFEYEVTESRVSNGKAAIEIKQIRGRDTSIFILLLPVVEL